jgi:UDP-GlcNAc3NAcA epimerase
MIKILTVVGARPQFVKSSVLSRKIKENFSDTIQELVVHTGQHYDKQMSDVFFSELGIKKPDISLRTGSGTHAEQTGKIMIALENVIKQNNADYILVYGDTNSTLSAALVASKHPIPLIHVEAGLRSNRIGMPEEINRIVTDRLSNVLFCSSVTSVNNLKSEGITKNVFDVGDIMYDQFCIQKNKSSNKTLKKFKLSSKKFILSTIHRAENTDNFSILKKILNSLDKISINFKVVIPLHPRTRKIIEQDHSFNLQNICFTNPLSYLEMMELLLNSSLVITDSGGLQKEAYFANVPCITVREETEWVELVKSGWNKLCPPSSCDLIKSTEKMLTTPLGDHPDFYGDGKSADKILSTIIKLYENSIRM